LEVADQTDSVRLDIWMWRARFFKTRAFATSQIKRRGVRLTRGPGTRRIDKPGTSISVGDIVTFGRGPHIRSVEVLMFGTRRGPADEARRLYREIKDDET
jgi:ribosome-associated heat shock protein Hsp15